MVEGRFLIDIRRTGLNGTPAAAQLAGEADLVFCIGTRLHDFVTGSSSAFHDPNVRFASVNVNGRDAYKLGALPITADAKLALRALTAAGRAAPSAISARTPITLPASSRG